MNPVFFKELPLIIHCQGKPQLVDFAAGFSKAVDPESGMTVNLKDILSWQEQWKKLNSATSFTTWFQFLKTAQDFFSKEAQLQKAENPIVQIRFSDRSVLRFEKGHFSMTRTKPMVDSLGRLQVCEVQFQLITEADFQAVMNFQMPSDLPGSFDESEMLLNLFESQLGLPVQRMEILDVVSQISIVIP